MRKLSIVVPFFEKHEAWWKTWDELKIQLDPEDEVIIVDDYSISGPPDCDCPLVRIIHPSKTKEHVYRLNTNRNVGIKAAKNDAIIILDPDCIPAPDFVSVARKNFDAGVLFGGRIDFQQENWEIEEDPRLSKKRRTGMRVWGGCMMFSKNRTKRLDWFSVEYDGSWGLDDNDFAHKCYHSGMIISYLKKLRVLHQYHERYGAGHDKNMKLLAFRRRAYASRLDNVTRYRPQVAVCILTLMRPYYLKRCLRSLVRTKTPIKIFLVNQGDTSEEQMKIIDQWKGKWAVHYIFNDPPKWPGPARAEMFNLARDMGFKYLVTVDDDCYLYPNAIENLVKAADEHPEFHGISGFVSSKSVLAESREYMLGGRMQWRIKSIAGEEDRKLFFQPFGWEPGVREAEYICNGLRIVRLNPLITPDPEWTMGMTDYDWSMQVRERGLRLAVCGEAGALHKYILTGKRGKRLQNPVKYDRKYRRNPAEIERMKQRFAEKWGMELL